MDSLRRAMKITDAEIKRLRELCEDATKGPWVQIDDDASSTSPLSYLRDANRMHVCYAEGEITIQNNLPFIAASRTALPALLDALEEARKALRKIADTDPLDAYIFTLYAKKVARAALGDKDAES